MPYHISRVTAFDFMKGDHMDTHKLYYESDTEFGWIKIELYDDGSTTIHCEDTSYEEILEHIQLFKNKEK